MPYLKILFILYNTIEKNVICGKIIKIVDLNMEGIS